MSNILAGVLFLDVNIANGTDHNLNGIWVDEIVVTANEDRAHLSNYGFITENPEPDFGL